MGLRTIKEIKDLAGKRVLIRVDFNVPIEKNEIQETFRVKAVLPTINYLVKKQAKVILISHLGRPDGKKDNKLSLSKVADYLSDLMGKRIFFVNDRIGRKLKNELEKLKSGQVVLLENLRFYKEEEENNNKFAKKLASLGDIYVNDAFAVSHRAHASVEAITKFLPSYAEFLLEKEIEVLSSVFKNPKRPLGLVLGGVKFETKLPLIKKFMTIADNIVIGGALANTLLLAKGIGVGKSFVEKQYLDEFKDVELANSNFHIPVDVRVSNGVSGKSDIKVKAVGNIEEKEIVLDIGPETEKLFSNIIKESKMVVWNGPMGLFEVKEFASGSEKIARSIASGGIYSVVGGGDTISLIEKLKLFKKYSFVSTGGGAMLEFLSGKKLPGIEALKQL